MYTLWTQLYILLHHQVPMWVHRLDTEMLHIWGLNTVVADFRQTSSEQAQMFMSCLILRAAGQLMSCWHCVGKAAVLPPLLLSQTFQSGFHQVDSISEVTEESSIFCVCVFSASWEPLNYTFCFFFSRTTFDRNLAGRTISTTGIRWRNFLFRSRQRGPQWKRSRSSSLHTEEQRLEIQLVWIPVQSSEGAPAAAVTGVTGHIALSKAWRVIISEVPL